MTEATKKSILSFVKKRTNRDDLEIGIKDFEGDYYFILTIDVARADKNTSEYDEGYRKFVFNEDKKFRFPFQRADVLAPIISDLKKYMDIKIIKTIFDFKNHDYLDDIDKEINSAVKNTSQPQVKFDFDAVSDEPYIYLTCYNFNSKNSREEFMKYIVELEEVMGFKYDLMSYRLMTRYVPS